MEYSGYANRATVEAAPTVDWSGILTELKTGLQKNEADREAIRQKQATDTQKALEDINAVNKGQSQTGNEYITNASYQAKTLLNDAYKMYTSGQMSREKFNIMKQNTSATFSDINGTMKGLQDDYLKYQELSQKGELSGYSDYMQTVKGKLADLSNKTLYFNPTDGKGYIATVKEDGSVDKDNLMQTNWLKINSNFFDPKVKVEEEVGKFTGKMKEFTRIMDTRYGKGIWTVEDPTARAEFDKLSSDISKTIVSTPLRMASVLTDFVDDKQYTYTQNQAEAEKDNTKILLKADANGSFQPQLTKEQIADGEAAIKRVIKSQLGYKETQVEDTYRPPVFAPKDGKKEEPVPNISDIIFSSSLKVGGKYIPAQRFIANVPVVDPSTGTKKTIKSIIIDPTNGEVEMDIETSGESISGAPTVRTISTKKNGISGKGAKLRIDEINNMVRFIYSDKRGRSLQNYKELVEEKIGETQAIADRNKRGSTSNMVNVQLSNGQVGSIPANQLSAFLKENKGSKKI
jgi:hypothetical protein